MSESRVACFTTSRTFCDAEKQSYTPMDSGPLPTSRQIDPTIHILGTGSIGKLVAHALRGLPNPPPVTLLLHKGSLYEDWIEGSKRITLVTNGTVVSHSGYEAQLARAGFRMHGRVVGLEEVLEERTGGRIAPHRRRDDDANLMPVPDNENKEPIRNLIVSVKAGQTIGALLSVKHRLTPMSSILFLQNGLGIIDEVNEKVFRDPDDRPTYLQGFTSHGVHSSTPWAATHTRPGAIYISILTDQRDLHRLDTDSSARYLLRTVCRSPVLAAIGSDPIQLLQSQLHTLAINCVINTITTLCDGPNGIILENYSLQRTAKLLLAEISLIIRNLPELQGLPNVSIRFSEASLFRDLIRTIDATKSEISSTLADVRSGYRTEIDYINGYIVRRGEEMGIKCFMNYMMQQMVKGKRHMIRRELLSELPLTEVGNKKADPFAVNRGVEDPFDDAI